MKTHRMTRRINCPVCNRVFDAHTNTGPERTGPRKGDLSVCLYCESFLIFNDDLTLRALTDDDRIELLVKVGEWGDQSCIEHLPELATKKEHFKLRKDCSLCLYQLFNALKRGEMS